MKWQDAPVSKTKLSGYAQDLYGSWDVVWDVSNGNTTEFVARKDGKIVYVKYTPSLLEKLPESKRAKELAWRIDHFDELADFRSFAEVKNDNRLRKLGL